MNDEDLRDLLACIAAPGRDVLRRAARAEQWERDELARRLLREEGGRDAADLVDLMSLHPAERRRIARLLGELEAGT
jgi:hypothetical protein